MDKCELWDISPSFTGMTGRVHRQAAHAATPAKLEPRVPGWDVLSVSQVILAIDAGLAATMVGGYRNSK